MKSEADVVKFYQQWYGIFNFRFMPKTPAALVRFIASHSIPAVALPAIYHTCTYSVQNSKTAYTDGQKVVIPSWYFNADALAGAEELEIGVWKSVALMNGSTLHECLHVQQQRLYGVECNLQWMVEQSARLTAQHAKYGNIVYDIVNLVEDVYIEATQEGTGLYPLLTAKNIILLPADAMDGADVNTAQGLMQMMITYKNPCSRENAKWGETEVSGKIWQILESIVDAGIAKSYLQTRLDAVADIVDLMAEELDEMPEPSSTDETMYMVMGLGKALGKVEKGEEKGAGSGAGEDGDEGEDGEGAGKGKGMPFEGMHVVMVLTGDTDADGADAEKWEGVAITNYADEVYGDFNPERWAVHQYTMGEYRKQNPRSAVDSFAVVDDVSDLKQAVLYMDKTTKLGTPEKSGLYIDRERVLSLWGDKRVFSRRNKVTQTLPEIVILGDGSGSMLHSSRGISLYSKVLATGEKIHNAMMGIPHVFCIHSTETQGEMNGLQEAVVLVDVDGFNMYSSDIENPFKEALHFSCRNNADGLAIAAASKKFTANNGKKIMMVLSDGQPYASGNYSSRNAMNHTKETVEALREQGIIVLGVALTRDVVETNETIYGAEYTVDASVNVTDALETVLVRVISE